MRRWEARLGGRPLKRVIHPGPVRKSRFSLAPAAAETKTETFTIGPITVGPYQVKQEIDFGVPKPAEDAYITAMDVDIVDQPGGARVPIDRLMLHHIVFANLGRTLGDRRDGTCTSFTSLDNDYRAPRHRRALLRGRRGARPVDAPARPTATRAAARTRGCSLGC